MAVLEAGSVAVSLDCALRLVLAVPRAAIGRGLVLPDLLLLLPFRSGEVLPGSLASTTPLHGKKQGHGQCVWMVLLVPAQLLRRMRSGTRLTHDCLSKWASPVQFQGWRHP